MGEGGHNVPLVITPSGIRKLTPKECFNAQGFPENFKLPSDLNDAKLYKQAGNSVCVAVISRIAERIYYSIEKEFDCSHCDTHFSIRGDDPVFCPYCGKRLTNEK